MRISLNGFGETLFLLLVFVQDKFFHEPRMNILWIIDVLPMSNFSKTCFVVILNVCVSLLVVCCSLHSKAKETLKNNKREEQQGKNNKQQEENTQIRIIRTKIKTVRVIQHI